MRRQRSSLSTQRDLRPALLGHVAGDPDDTVLQHGRDRRCEPDLVGSDRQAVLEAQRLRAVQRAADLLQEEVGALGGEDLVQPAVDQLRGRRYRSAGVVGAMRR